MLRQAQHRLQAQQSNINNYDKLYFLTNIEQRRQRVSDCSGILFLDWEKPWQKKI